MNDKIVEIIFIVSPSLNKIKHYWNHYKYKKLYLKQLKNYNYVSNLLATKKRKLIIERYNSRKLDKDNFIGGCKPLIDALCDYGLIVDDREQYLESEYIQIKCKRGYEKIKVTIYNYEETLDKTKIA